MNKGNIQFTTRADEISKDVILEVRIPMALLMLADFMKDSAGKPGALPLLRFLLAEAEKAQEISNGQS